ncbi:non-ribosomal peptide synthetase [Vibrio nigripulchritudo]|uniref:non-ribosomal peptide synthetase n=1 Tax=Vibrio nigripulchritudo TaxID=28173 RepID=UPI0003B19535|nr:non-ribosomal peptide synthetase [Vibrio nigripulchritudo]CCN72479.1 putative Polyketide synthase (Fatty acid synthase/beta-ketoacyl synthase) [Vibrio nigripulchritudo SFn118]
MIELFEEIVASHPDQLAIEDGEKALTYAQLDRLSGALAAHFDGLGIKSGDRLGVCLPRSIELVATLLAAVKMGVCYVPVEPSTPQKRREELYQQCGIETVVSESTILSKWVRESDKEETVALSPIEQEFTEWLSHIDTLEAPMPLCSANNREDLACLFFTSGSTGVPKGVSVLCTGIQSVVHQPNYVPIELDNRVGCLANPTFDALTFEVWGALLNGATIVVVNQESLVNPALLASKLKRSRIDVAFMTTGLFNLMALEDPQALASIQHLLVGGEAFVPANAAYFFDADKTKKARLYNAYGPTECTTFSACHPILPERLPEYIESGRVPIGKGINQTQVHIVVDRNRFAQPGEIGEIAITGPALAKGYFGDQHKTEARFLFLPWLNEKAYLSGDLGRINELGEIEFLGREDQQVKVRGHRIELTEIEQVLQSHPSVMHASCTPVKDQETDIYAYLVLESDASKESLRTHLKQHLPAYMLPHRYFAITNPPLNKNGKLDRRQLRKMENREITDSDNRVISARAELLRQAPVSGEYFMSLTKGVLHLTSEPNLDESFVECGGDSLKAMRLVARLREKWDCSLSVGDVMSSESLLSVAKQIEQQALIPQEAGAEWDSEKQDGSRYLASPEQARLALLQYLNPSSVAYNAPYHFEIQGELDVDAFKKAWAFTVKHHGALRSIFLQSDGQIEVVERDYEDSLFGCQWLGNQTHKLDNIANAVFDIENDALCRAAIAQPTNKNTYHLVLCFHHLVIDGWSVNVLLKAVSDAYHSVIKNRSLAENENEDPFELRLTPVSYSSFSLKRQQYHQSRSAKVARAFWQQQSQLSPPTLFGEHAPLCQSNNTDGTHEIILNDDLWCAAKSCAKQQGISLYSLLLAAFSLTLNRYFQQDRVSVASPVANREGGDFESLVGMCANTCLFQVDMPSGLSVDKYLALVNQVVVQTQKHQEIDFGEVAALHIDRNQDIIEAMLVLENTDTQALNLDGLALTAKTLFSGEAKFPLTLFVTDLDEKAECVLEFQGSKLNLELVSQFARSFSSVLNNLATQPNSVIHLLPVFNQEQMAQQMGWSEQPQMESLTWKRLDEWFDYQASVTPDALAVELGEARLTYYELHEQSNRIAQALAEYVEPDGSSIVGVSFHRSPEVLIAILGILKTGAAYLPLDPDYPSERLERMIEMSGVALTIGGTHSVLQHHYSCKTIAQLLQGFDGLNAPDKFLNLAEMKTDRAYVLYTSGSTGTPKGVDVSHRSLLNYLSHCTHHYYRSTERGVVSSSINFDATITTLLAPLVAGKTVTLVEQDGNEIQSILNALTSSEPAVFKLTPTHLKALSFYLDSEQPFLTNHTLVVGGEAFDAMTAKRIANSLPNTRIINEYGPTEATVGCTTYSYRYKDTFHSESKLASVPIGKPISGTAIYVLNPYAQPCPVSVQGEIYISGNGLANGYLNQPDTTLERFVRVNVFGETHRLYKTGDLGYWNEQGELIYCGRNDEQVKLNGYRIELGEIENALANVLTNAACAVVLKSNSEGMETLIAYCQMSSERLAENKTRYIDLLSQQLPDFMVPKLFVAINALPETPNGKLDRDALPVPKEWFTATKEVSNQSEMASSIGQRLHTVFNELLGHPIDPDRHFFEAGFNSLSLMKVHSHIIKDDQLSQLTPPIKLVDLFAHSSVRKLTEYVENSTPVLASDIQNSPSQTSDVAVIGMAVNLPNADNLEAFWRVIQSGEECIQRIEQPDDNTDPSWVYVRSSMEGVDTFDAGYFGISEHDAKLMDPQQRHALMSAVHALEDAGIQWGNANPLGVVMSASDNTYGSKILRNSNGKLDDYALSLLNEKDFISTRIAYHLNLTGPAITSQTACSSSLVAIHQACRQIQTHECDIALAGGVNADLDTLEGYAYREGMILSKDGHCKPFSKHAGGTVPANGIGMVVLKRLDLAQQNGDRIYAVIKGSAVNNDGKDKVSFYAPSVKGQVDVIVQAQKNAGVISEQMDYLEAHGTGTKLGDPIEIEALDQAFERNRSKGVQSQKCLIGSTKSQMGHLGSAAGVTGFIRTALALYREELPKATWNDEPNPDIDFSRAGLLLTKDSYKWNGNNRVAGVSSFGMGGTNAHVILGSYDAENPPSAGSLPLTQFAKKPYLSDFYHRSVTAEPSERAEFEDWFREACWQRATKVSQKETDLPTLVYNSELTHCPHLSEVFHANTVEVTNIEAFSASLEALSANHIRVNVLYCVDEKNPLWQGVALIQACLSAPQNMEVSLVCLLKGVADVTGDEALMPDNSAVIGLANTVSIEQPNLSLACLDVTDSASTSQLSAGIATLFERLNKQTEESAEHINLYALRGRYLWKPAFQPYHFENEAYRFESEPYRFENKAVAMPDSGVYIVTGGTGGIGQHLCEYLSSLNENNVVISVSRSASDSSLSTQPGIQTVQCDVSYSEQWHTLIDSVATTFGKVTGIVHVAGSAGGAMLHSATASNIESSQNAKTAGAQNIVNSARQYHPEFVVFCSSMSSVYPVAGQTDYCAANTFLNQLAVSENQSGTVRYISLNFPTWAKTGMAKAVEDTAFAITPEEGVRVFERAVESGEGVIYVSPLKPKFAQAFFHRLNSKPERTSNIEQSAFANSNVREQLTRIFSEVLGMDESEIETDVCFYDLGGDSLTVLDLFDELNATFRNQFTLAELNHNISIDRLVEKLECGAQSDSLAPDDGEIDVVIHPVGGEVSGYRYCLENYPKNRTVLTLRDPLLGDEPEFLSTIESLAEHYHNALKGKKVSRVIGWSFGAVIALEMAKKLDPVVKLVLIDPPALDDQRETDQQDLNQVFVSEIIQQYPELEGLLNYQSSVSDIVKALSQQGHVQASEQTQQYLEKVVSTCQKNAAALATYRSTHKVSNPTCLFYASEHEVEEQQRMLASWQIRLLNMTSQVVNGDHYSILHNEGSKAMIEVLQSY